MISKRTVALSVALLFAAATAGAQQPVPAAVYEPTPAPVAAELDRPLSGAQLQRLPGGREVPRGGILTWGLTASSLTTASDESNYTRVALYTDVDYLKSSAKSEFDLRYNGGMLLAGNGDSRDSSFHNFALTGSRALGRWIVSVGDTVSYQPESQAGGGTIAGLGQFLSALPFSNLNPNLLPDESVLSFNTPQVSNSTFAQGQYSFSRSTSATLVASYGLLKYLDYSDLDSHQWVFTAGLDHSLRHSRMATRYTYMRYGYQALNGGVEGHAAELMYATPLGRNLNAEFSVGPQLIQLHGTAGEGHVIPAGYVSLNYARRYNSLSLRYQRGLNGGSGFMRGAVGDTVEGTLGRHYRNWGASLYGSYVRNAGLSESGRVFTRTAEVRLDRNMGRNLSGYVSYGFQVQSNGVVCTGPVCPFDGSQHTVGAGLTWHPKGITLQ